jgi:hypothetical protein
MNVKGKALLVGHYVLRIDARAQGLHLSYGMLEIN